MLKNDCTRNCWLASGLVGVLVWIAISGFFAGLLMGLIAFVLLGNFLVWGICEGSGGLGDSAMSKPAGDSRVGALQSSKAAVANAGAVLAKGAAVAASKTRSSVQAMRENRNQRAALRAGDAASQTPRNRAGSGVQQAGQVVKTAAGALAARGKKAFSSDDSDRQEDTIHRTRIDRDLPGKQIVEPDVAQLSPTSDPADVTDTPPAESAPQVSAPGVTELAGAHPKAAGGPLDADATKPSGRVSPADDLRQIRGIGPKLAGILRDNGVRSFSAMAGWTDRDIDKFAQLVGRSGKQIRQDGWVDQARQLAGGDRAEPSSGIAADRGAS